MVQKILSDNFLFYASYVIRDRAIPHIDDGLKPVQRRILHSLFEMDDGKFHKVSNVVGNTMKYHPHGDNSIFMALVVLANKELFIEKQGNFGNIFTGDEASAARYIECRINSFAKTCLYYPRITDYVESYDGRNREPTVFPALLPFALILGAEGIAVGMSTTIMPHNCLEVMQAVQAALKKESFALYPDFPTGGYADVSAYQDGMGKILLRAGIDVVSDKRIVIRELPYGRTTSSLIASIEAAVRKGKINISEINDYTAETAEIECRLGRGERAADIIDSLYALTDCEISISLNCLLIKDNKPCKMTVREVIEHYADRIQRLLKYRLEVECNALRKKLHANILERLFIGEKIYQRIEKSSTLAAMHKAIRSGFEPFLDRLEGDLQDEDIEYLLKIPIRRISLYDQERSQAEERQLRSELAELQEQLSNIRRHAINYLDGLMGEYAEDFPRKSKIIEFTQVHAREVSARDISIYYDAEKQQLGYKGVAGEKLMEVSEFDRLLLIRDDGSYTVIAAPARLYVAGLVMCMLAEKDLLAKTIISIIYADAEQRAYIKRCHITQFMFGKEYTLLPPNTKLLVASTKENVKIHLRYRKAPYQRKSEEEFELSQYLIKGVRANGKRLSERAVARARFKRSTTSTANL